MHHHQPLEARLDGSRFHGTLRAGPHSWHVYFTDVSRLDRDWMIDCVVVGPVEARVTIRCPVAGGHADAARRVMRALADWLAAGSYHDAAYLEVPEALGRAS